jgi:hypothetical protein
MYSMSADIVQEGRRVPGYVRGNPVILDGVLFSNEYPKMPEPTTNAKPERRTRVQILGLTLGE